MVQRYCDRITNQKVNAADHNIAAPFFDWRAVENDLKGGAPFSKNPFINIKSQKKPKSKSKEKEKDKDIVSKTIQVMKNYLFLNLKMKMLEILLVD